MDPIKYAIKQVISKKCTECQDLKFCKIPMMLQKIDKPDIRDLDHISKCIYYKKNIPEIQSIQSWL